MSETSPQTGQPPTVGAFTAALARLRACSRPPGLNPRGVALMAGLIGLLWLASGIYKVQPDEQGVVLRFGKWVETNGPGLHFHLPFPVERILLPKVTTVNQMPISRSEPEPASRNAWTANAPTTRTQMLTGDENIVEADAVVFWRIRDAGEYLFKVYDPEGTLKMAAESAMRDVVGRNPIQAALSDKRQQIAELIMTELQRLLDTYHAGILVTQVQLQRVDPPFAVIDAFNDVQRARADQERARNEGEAYRNDVLPRARAEAERAKQETEAYKTQVVNQAEGEVRGFEAIHRSYRDAPAIIGWRLYLDSVDEVLKRAGKVIVDASGKGMGPVLPYLPIGEQKDRPPALSPLNQGQGQGQTQTQGATR